MRVRPGLVLRVLLLVILAIGLPFVGSLFLTPASGSSPVFFAALSTGDDDDDGVVPDVETVTCLTQDGEGGEQAPPCPEGQWQDDIDPAKCMITVLPASGESAQHVFERKLECIIDNAGFSSGPKLLHTYSLAPAGASLADSLTQPVDLTVQQNTTPALTTIAVAKWVIQMYATGTSLFSASDIVFNG